MLEFAKTFLESSPLTALFLAIGLGYVLGEINIKGFSLGSGAVLFVGLAIGAFAPKSVPAGMVGTLGLLLFLYCVGLQYGKEFFRGLSSLEGLKANIAALAGVLAAGAIGLLFTRYSDLTVAEALGMFAGAGTSTATLQAALNAFKSNEPAVGYAVAYPFGVAGPILFLYLYNAIFKPKVAAPPSALIESVEVAVENEAWFGRRFTDLAAQFPASVNVVAIREQSRNRVPAEDTILDKGHVLLIVSTEKDALAAARELLGSAQPGRIAKDRRDLDYVRVYASKRSIVGLSLGDLDLPGDLEYSYVHVRRGDTDLLPHSDLVLEFGDRIGFLAPRERFADLRKYFGDSIKGQADFSYITVGLGAAIGLMVGAIPITIPGLTTFRLGLAGVLLMALVFGKLRRTAGLVWTMPLSANLMLRNFGLTVFLAQVGISVGPDFANSVAETGLTYLGIGAVILLGYVVVSMFIARVVFKLPVDLTFGIVSGTTGNPAILAYAARAMPTDKPDVGYAMIFPSMTVAKILFVEVVAAIVLKG